MSGFSGADNIAPGCLRWQRVKRFPTSRVAEVERYQLAVGDVVLAMDRPWIEAGLKYAVVREEDIPCLLVQRVARLRTKSDSLDQAFLGLIIGDAAFTNYVVGVQTGSAVPHISGSQIGNFEFELPPVVEQHAIAATLGALDDKIESNRRTTESIAALADCLYVGAIKQGRREAKIGDIAQFHNRRRIPLSSRERAQRPGRVPYYGATGIFGYVDEALFDEILVLVGEDGSVVREDGGPVLQYIWGPAWINNHAHPLTAVGISNELLYTALNRADIRPIVTGAVQPKVNMGNLKSFTIELPVDKADLESRLDCLFRVYRARRDETTNLIALRDTLLPELLSGRIRPPLKK